MSPSRAGAVGRQELRALLASPLLWALVLFAAFATLTVDPVSMIPTGDSAMGGLRPFSNSPHAIARIFSLTGLLFYPFLVSILAGSSILRDDEARVGDLLHSTRLTPGEYVAGKFGGILLAVGVVLVLHTAIAVGWSKRARNLGLTAARGPFRLASYVVPALAFLAPGAIFCAGLALAVAERTRAAMAVYVAPVLLVLSGLAGLAPRGSSRLDAVLGFLFSAFDLWGTRWLDETIFRTDRGVAFYNGAPLAFDAVFLWNRLFVLAVPLAAVFLSARHRRAALRGESGGRESATALGAGARHGVFSSSRRAPDDFPAARARGERVGDRPGRARASAPPARARPARRTRPARRRGGGLVVPRRLRLRGDPDIRRSRHGPLRAPGRAGGLLVLFVVVESLDRARRLRVADLLHVTPVPPAAYLLGTQLAACAVIGEILLGCAAVGGASASSPPSGTKARWRRGPSFSSWGLILGPTFVAWANAVAALQCLLRSRYLTYAAGLAVLGEPSPCAFRAR